MIYFLIYLLLEVFITINLGGTIGIVATFIEIVFTFLLGLFYIMNFKYSMVETLSQVLKQRITKEQFIGKNLTSFFPAISPSRGLKSAGIRLTISRMAI